MMKLWDAQIKGIQKSQVKGKHGKAQAIILFKYSKQNGNCWYY